MKTLLLISVFVCSFAGAAPRTIELKTEKIDGAVHWVPKKVEVTQGETVQFMLKHNLEGGFDFHGFFIPALKISEQVSRNQNKAPIEAKIPTDMKPGDYEIGCQFHPTHKPATLVVKPKKVG